MNNVMKVLAIIFMMNVGTSLTINKANAQGGDVSFQVFYDDMSPYGNWVDYPGTGYVWIPNVDAGFSPYQSNGHWVMTDYGWTWVSDYPWGWAPFHYGRWNYDNSYGWGWCPDNEWGPAWVSWRSCDGYYGWCPMGYGMSLEGSYGRGGYSGDDNRWVFVHDRDFGRSDISNHYESRSNNASLMRSSTVINNTYADNSRHATYVAGPTRAEVQRTTGKPVQSMKITDGGKSGGKESGGTLAMYRPQVQKSTAGATKPAPKSVISSKDVKPVGSREYVNQQKPVTPVSTAPKKAEPVKETHAKAKAEEPKTNVPIAPKKVEPVEKKPTQGTAQEPKRTAPVSPVPKSADPVPQKPSPEKVVESKKAAPPAPQPKKTAPPVVPNTRQDYINKARANNRQPAQPARSAPAPQRSPVEHQAPARESAPPSQPTRQNTPPPQPAHEEGGHPRN